MKKAILIHVHRDPTQVKRLVSHLQHPDVDIYINVDARVDIEAFRTTIPDVYYINNRVEVIWGRFSQVQQILNSFDEILGLETKYSHVLFLSGQDYPLKNMESIVSELNKNIDKSYIDYTEVTKAPIQQFIRNRYEYWYFLPKRDIRNQKIVRKLIQKLGYKRKYPTPIVYFGACWFCLTTEAVEYVLNYVKSNPRFVTFNQHTGCADELFFQSIIINSPLKNMCINNIYRYVVWEKGAKNPKDLGVEDFEEIKKSDAWFARKINVDKDQTILDLLDTLNKD